MNRISGLVVLTLLQLMSVSAQSSNSTSTGGTSTSAGTSTSGSSESLLYPSRPAIERACAQGTEYGKTQVQDRFVYTLKLAETVYLLTPGDVVSNECDAMARKFEPAPRVFRLNDMFVYMDHDYQDLLEVPKANVSFLFQRSDGQTLLNLTPFRKLYDLGSFTRPCGNDKCKAHGRIRFYFILPPVQKTAGTTRLEADVDYGDGTPPLAIQLYPPTP